MHAQRLGPLTCGFLPWMESAPRTVVFAMAVVVRHEWRCLGLLGSQGRACRIGPRADGITKPPGRDQWAKKARVPTATHPVPIWQVCSTPLCR